jgi:hypothetical protein
MCQPHMVCEPGHLREQFTGRKAINGRSQRSFSLPASYIDWHGSPRKEFRDCRRLLPGQSAAGVPDRVSPLAAHKYPACPTSLPAPTGTPHASGTLEHTRPASRRNSIKHTSSTRWSPHRSIPPQLCTSLGRHIPASGSRQHILATALSRCVHC